MCIPQGKLVQLVQSQTKPFRAETQRKRQEDCKLLQEMYLRTDSEMTAVKKGICIKRNI